MKQIRSRLKFMMLLCGLSSYSNVNAQIVNGTFEQNAGTVVCSAPYGWTTYIPNPSTPNVKWDQRTVISSFGASYHTWFADIGGCDNSHGNGTWIQQNVNTIPKRTHKISFDLGFLVGNIKQMDAGVRLFVNGVQQTGPQNGRFAHYDFIGVSSRSFKRFEYCFCSNHH